MKYRLLDEFRALFHGKRYLHRDSSRGDWVAQHLYEDLYTLGKSTRLKHFVDSRERVIDIKNKRVGVKSRRGDGSFGEMVPGAVVITDPGFVVARAPIANVEIGVEVKILAKAMIKQIDRVKTDLDKQVIHFQKGGNKPICIGVVGINAATYTVSYEGEATCPVCGTIFQISTRTDGKKHKHPMQEAKEAEKRIEDEVRVKFDELIFLRYRATNDDPYLFEWVNELRTFGEYGAALTRISRRYDVRFGGGD